jgi:voltage-gated potassium channel
MDNKLLTEKTRFYQENRFLIMLLALVGVILFHPMIDNIVHIQFLIEIFISLLFLSCIFAVSFKKHHPIIAALLALPTFTIMWTSHFIDIGGFEHVKNLFGMLFMLYLTILFLEHFFRQNEINREVIFGSLVVYLLMGLMWGYGYTLLEHLLPGSFTHSASLSELDLDALDYFSFVTMTTLGYGDITPASDSARAMVMTQTVSGQVYLAVLVARLVGLNIAQELKKKE